MRRKILLGIFLVLLVVAILFKSPFSARYNYNKGKALYDQGKYEQALPYFERSLFADSKGLENRYFYANALSKSKPTYSVQKKLYELSEYKTNDEATKAAKAKASQMRYTLLSGIGNNYIYNTPMGSDIVRWDARSFPLKVYIENSANVPAYYFSNIRAAMNQWVSRTTFVKFTEVKNESDAQIVIRFKDLDSSVCSSGVCKYIVAYTEPTISASNTLKRMTLTFYKTNPNKQNFNSQEIYSTALHELGHTLGIMGHSDSPGDIMYSVQDKNARTRSIFGNMRLSERDLKTLVLLYRTKPDISNTLNLNSETFYYAPLIIGDDDVLISKKIAELKKYIHDYPQISTGYINLGGAYADMGDFENALLYMQSAEKYARSNDEKYLIAYNRAIIYYNMQNRDSAMQYAQQAQGYKADPSVSELIDEISKMK